MVRCCDYILSEAVSASTVEMKPELSREGPPATTRLKCCQNVERLSAAGRLCRGWQVFHEEMTE